MKLRARPWQPIISSWPNVDRRGNDLVLCSLCDSGIDDDWLGILTHQMIKVVTDSMIRGQVPTIPTTVIGGWKLL